MNSDFVVERSAHVVVGRIDRPESRNALNAAVMLGLGAMVLDAESDSDIRCIVLTGTGDRAFCAGMDLAAFSDGTALPAMDAPPMVAFTRLMRGEVSVPVIGAANGAAVGGGLELLLGCDLVIASSLARFGLPEVKRGLIPGGSGTSITRRIPYSWAMELLLTGDLISAQRAAEIGLVNSVVAPEVVHDTAIEIAGRIGANGPLAITATKELGRLAASDSARWTQRLAELQSSIFSSDDAREGALAFVERREPRWTGH